MIRLLMLGDIVGRAGREMVLKKLPELRREWKLDCIIVNTDNASGGFGVTSEHCAALHAAGADVLAGGDHIWDQREMLGKIESMPYLLRPLNFPDHVPGRGQTLITTAKGANILIVHALGQVFLNDYLDSPFAAVDAALYPYKLGATVDAIIVDFHAEATSEKCAMGLYCDGRVSVVAGSHTHIPTADQRILPKGTAYITDMGMCGDYQSVIGFEEDGPLHIFTHKLRKTRMTPAKREATLCGFYVEIDEGTGLARKAEPVRIGGHLEASTPV